MSQKPTLEFVYFDAGGGHRSAALALQSVIQSEGYDWNVRLMNLQEVLDSLDIFRKVTGFRLQDLYNVILAKGWTLGSSYLLPMMHGVIRVYHRAQVTLLAEYWQKNRPDMVVSLVPNFDRALFQSLRLAIPEAPFVTVLTDFADYPPHFWMEKQPPQYFICGTTRAVKQAERMGHPSAHTFQASGMILRPQFYEEQRSSVPEERRRLGLDPSLPTGLVLFGGEGSNVMHAIADRLGNSTLNLQLILVCGRNAKLKGRLKQLRSRNRLFVEGFTKQIPYYMHLADFFIGKPGPGSITEALKMKLPVILERNAWTLPQERYNTEWVKEQGVGLVLKNFRDIEPAVRELLNNGQLTEMKAKIGQMDNQAVYEVPRLLERILSEHQAKIPARASSRV